MITKNLLSFVQDYSFSVGVFEYFTSLEYAEKAISEMIRVTKKAIYILNIRKDTTQINTKVYQVITQFLALLGFIFLSSSPSVL